jgi:hypothetical protein
MVSARIRCAIRTARLAGVRARWRSSRICSLRLEKTLSITSRVEASARSRASWRGCESVRGEMPRNDAQRCAVASLRRMWRTRGLPFAPERQRRGRGCAQHCHLEVQRQRLGRPPSVGQATAEPVVARITCLPLARECMKRRNCPVDTAVAMGTRLTSRRFFCRAATNQRGRTCGSSWSCLRRWLYRSRSRAMRSPTAGGDPKQQKHKARRRGTTTSRTLSTTATTSSPPPRLHLLS